MKIPCSLVGALLLVYFGMLAKSSYCGDATVSGASVSGAAHGDGRAWRRLDGEARLDVLKLLENTTRANYQAIRTWRGVYAIRMYEVLADDYVADSLPDIPVKTRTSGLARRTRSRMRFVIDSTLGNVYRACENTEMEFMKHGTKEKVELPNSRAAERRSIVTNEHFIEFSPKDVWPGFGFLPDRADFQNRRVAFRWPREESDRRGLGDLMDPRDLFSFGDHKQTFGDELGLYTRALQGESGEEMRAKASRILVVYEREVNGDKLFRLVNELSNPAGDVVYFSTTWSAAVGFQPVAAVRTVDREEMQPVQSTVWEWKKSDGIYLPYVVRLVIHGDRSPEVSYEREVELIESQVNSPLKLRQFGYTGLGLEEGDLIVDHIEKAAYIMRGEEVTKVANFNEARSVEPWSGHGISWGRGLFLFGNIAFLTILLFALRRKRRGADV